MEKATFDVIIVGGSYAGMAAAMSLGRSMRNVLIIDSGKPCNRQTPHAHNLITHDGNTPRQIAAEAKAQVMKYETVQLYEGFAVRGSKVGNGFEVETSAGDIFKAKKLLMATGVSDQMPAIEGFAECWGISVLHCPYCHGYEVKGQKIGVIGNGDMGFDFAKLISNWSKDLMLFTNGKSSLTTEQTGKLSNHQIVIIDKAIAALRHEGGYLKEVIFTDGTTQVVSAVFARVAFEQACEIPEQLGCGFTEYGFIQTDDFQQTTVAGVFAAGDITSMFRALPIAIAAGTKAGAIINKELIEEEF